MERTEECDFCNRAVDEIIETVLGHIEKYGVSIIANPEHSVSMGIMSTLGKPDILIDICSPNAAKIYINNHYNQLKEGNKYVSDKEYYGILADPKYPVMFKKINEKHYEELYGKLYETSVQICGKKKREIWQLVFPDSEGKFPWDEECQKNFAEAHIKFYD